MNGTPNGTPSKLARPFLHPTVSRLRSFTPQSSSLMASTSSAGTVQSRFGVASPTPSHFSVMSRRSSISNLQALSASSHGNVRNSKEAEREVFKWTHLRNIGNHIFISKAANKASSILGAPTIGCPTVLAANGLICVGTDEGKICVFDFKQTLICVCGNQATGSSFLAHLNAPVNQGLAKTCGPVTALALSFDHTYVASGHAMGYIQLYDIKNPQTPARSVPPTTLAAVSSGRKEGHIQGSRIVSVGFIAGRHTAMVSADEHGLAFYHSLGKVLFVEASDILRILGKYGPSLPLTPLTPSGNSPETPTARRRRSRYTVLAMMPLPLGTVSHPTDSYNIIALLTPTKLVVVALKPTPKTWFKCPHDDETDDVSKSRKRKGTLSWFPSVLPNSTEVKKPSISIDVKDLPPVPTTPQLAFTWGRTMHLIKVFETKTKQLIKNSRTGSKSEAEVGVIDFRTTGKWSAEEDILAVQWLNDNVGSFTPAHNTSTRKA